MKTRKLTKLAACVFTICLWLSPRIGNCQSCVNIVDLGCPAAQTIGQCSGVGFSCGGTVTVVTGPDDMQCEYTDYSPYSTCVPGNGNGQLNLQTMTCGDAPGVVGDLFTESQLEQMISESSDPDELTKLRATLGLTFLADRAKDGNDPCVQTPTGAPQNQAYQFINNTATGNCCPGETGNSRNW
jgi:hypothetical protein